MLIANLDTNGISPSDYIQIIIAFLTFAGVGMSLLTLKQNKKMIEESNRPCIEIFKDIIDIKNINEFIIIKNFGNTTAYIKNFSFSKDLLRLLSIKTDESDFFNVEMIKALEYLKEATLAPGQFYRIPITTKNCDLDKVVFQIEYNGPIKTYKETKTIYLKQDTYVVVRKAGENLAETADEKNEDIVEALTYVSNSLQEIIRKQT